MRVKVKLSDNDIAFVYNDVINIGEFLDIIQLMIKEKGTVLITKSSIEYIKVCLEESEQTNDWNNIHKRRNNNTIK